jgi:hypothetical protein
MTTLNDRQTPPSPTTEQAHDALMEWLVESLCSDLPLSRLRGRELLRTWREAQQRERTV